VNPRQKGPNIKFGSLDLNHQQSKIPEEDDLLDNDPEKY